MGHNNISKCLYLKLLSKIIGLYCLLVFLYLLEEIIKHSCCWSSCTQRNEVNEYDATYFHHQLSSTIFPPRNADDICAASEIGSDLAKLWQHATENSGDGGNPKILKMFLNILRKHCQPLLYPHNIFHIKHHCFHHKFNCHKQWKSLETNPCWFV